MASVHVSCSVFVLQIVEEQVLLGVLSHDPEKSRLRLHPVELFDERVVLEALHKLHHFSSQVEHTDLFGNGSSNPLRVDGIPLDSYALHFVAVYVVVAENLHVPFPEVNDF